MSTKRWWEYCLLPTIAALTVVVDQVTKKQVMAHLQPNESWAPLPLLKTWFSITHVNNTGAAFGLFPDYGNVFMLIAVIVVVAIAVYYWHMPAGQKLVKLSLGLQLGGAVGNLLDRLQYGHVVDFIDFKIWPVFNLADSSIVLGVLLLAYALLREPREDNPAAGQDEGQAFNRQRTGINSPE
mgnify:CR=1 FL=1